jgi:cysteine synthase B
MTRRKFLDLVGDTPMVELARCSPRPGVRLFAKLEGMNPSGSVKDRLALGLIQAAEEAGKIHPGDTIVEASSGNTAIALSMVAKQRGYGVKVVVPRGIVSSIEDVLRLLDAEIVWSEDQAGLAGAIRLAEKIAADEGHHLLGQFQNPLNVDIHYRTTGAEIVRELPDVDVFVGGIGTGGTVMGVARRLREHNPDVRIVGVEPVMGDKLQGLRSMDEAYAPPLVDLDQLDARFRVDSATAIRRAESVTHQEGIFVGMSCGACLHAALRMAERLDEANIVLMFSDGGWKYLPANPWDAARRDDPRLNDVHWW